MVNVGDLEVWWAECSTEHNGWTRNVCRNANDKEFGAGKIIVTDSNGVLGRVLEDNSVNGWNVKSFSEQGWWEEADFVLEEKINPCNKSALEAKIKDAQSMKIMQKVMVKVIS